MLEPVTILPDAVYDDGALHQSLGLTPAALATARRSGALRFCRQGKRILYLGAWILAWLNTDGQLPEQTASGEGETPDPSVFEREGA